LSALFVYYNARIEESMTDIDSGATIRDGIRGVKNYGICTEELWPYDVEKFDERPSISSYADARRRTLENYRRLYDAASVIRAVNNNRPVVIGMSVYVDFFDLDKENTIVQMPKDRVEDYFGEHAVYIVGYDQDKKMFLCKNSFGAEWGDNGYFWMPYDYAKSEMFEAWIFDIVVK
jgi:C1A family cysteine protease